MIINRFSKNSVHFFYIRLHQIIESDFEAFLATLPQYLIRKAHEFLQEKDKKAFVAGRFLLQNVLQNSHSSNFWANYRVDSYGKPYILGQNYFFNLSHSEDWLILAVSADFPVGVDVEHIKTIDYHSFKEFFSEKDWENITNSPNILHQFYRYWTWKESLIKADGRGLSIELKDVFLDQKSYILDRPNIYYYSQFLDLDPNYSFCVSWRADI